MARVGTETALCCCLYSVMVLLLPMQPSASIATEHKSTPENHMVLLTIYDLMWLQAAHTCLCQREEVSNRSYPFQGLFFLIHGVSHFHYQKGSKWAESKRKSTVAHNLKRRFWDSGTECCCEKNGFIRSQGNRFREKGLSALETVVPNRQAKNVGSEARTLGFKSQL